MNKFADKPGFALFKNDYKKTDTQPDYRGKGFGLNGEPIWASAWVREKDGVKYFSVSIQPREVDEKEGSTAKASAKKATTKRSDDIPF